MGFAMPSSASYLHSGLPQSHNTLRPLLSRVQTLRLGRHKEFHLGRSGFDLLMANLTGRRMAQSLMAAHAFCSLFNEGKIGETSDWRLIRADT